MGKTTTDAIANSNRYAVLAVLAALVCLVGVGAATIAERLIALVGK